MLTINNLDMINGFTLVMKNDLLKFYDTISTRTQYIFVLKPMYRSLQNLHVVLYREPTEHGHYRIHYTGNSHWVPEYIVPSENMKDVAKLVNHIQDYLNKI